MSNSGLLDTNVVIHALANDSHTDECKRFLAEVEEGRIRVRVDPIIVHELTYSIGRYKKHFSRIDIANIIKGVLSFQGVESNSAVLSNAVDRWANTPGLAFADAFLAATAINDRCPVYTKNVRELRGQGASVPDPLPQ